MTETTKPISEARLDELIADGRKRIGRGNADTVDALRELKALRQENEWISVQDRMPETIDKFWCWVIPRPANECPVNTSGQPITPIPFPPYRDIVGTYKTSTGEIRFNCGGLTKVTHWRLLLAPPAPRTEANDGV